MKASTKIIKVTFRDEIKRFSFPINFSELLRIVQLSFKLSDEDLKFLSISYLDDDNDNVQIANDYDYEQAVLFVENMKMDLLRIKIELCEKRDFIMVNPDLTMEKGIVVSRSISMEKQSIKDWEQDVIIESSLKEFVNDTNREEYDEFVKVVQESCCKDSVIKSLEGKIKSEVPDEIEKIIIVEEEKKLEKKKGNKKTKKAAKLLKKLKDCFENNICKVDQEKKEKIKEKKELCKDLKEKKAISKEKKQKKTKSKEKKENKIINQASNNTLYNFNSDLSQNVKNNINFDIENLKAQAYDFIFKEVNDKMERLKALLIGEITEHCFKYIEMDFGKEKISVHSTITCDGCGQNPILGNRYKCTICENFDYCEDCEEKFQHDHDHPFIKIRNSSQAPSKIVTIIPDNNSISDCSNLKKINNKVHFYLNKAIDNIPNLNFIKDEFMNLIGSKDKKCKLSSTGDLNTHIQTSNNNNILRKNFKIVNNGSEAWSKPSYFTCITDESMIYGNTVPIKVKIEPGKDANVEVIFDLKSVPCQGEYDSVWQLQNEKKEFFGEKFRFTIYVKFSNEIVVNEEYIEKGKPVIFKPLTCKELLEQTNSSDLVFNKLKENLKNVSDKEVNNAITRVGPNYDLCYKILSKENHSCNYHDKKKFN